MARIAGINLPSEKRIPIALTYIYGIGRFSADSICKNLSFDSALRLKELNDTDLGRLRQCISDYVVEGDLTRLVRSNIKKKVALGSYEGRRHREGLPVNGQRTKTNARTRKRGKRTNKSK